jgi:uncharacterized membrane protein
MAEDLPSRDILEQLVERLDHLERVLQANTARLHFIERRLGVEPPRPERARPAIEERYPDEVREAAPDVHAAEPATAAGAGDASEAAGGPGASVRDEAARSGVRPRAGGAREGKRRDIESLIGGSWFNWIGIIAVTFGVAFFLKYAFDNQWVGPGARVTLGAAGGLALLAVGERLRGRGLRQYAFVLSGGGILILYLSIYAAYNFYQLLPQPVAFLLMAVVTATAVLLSVRLDALPVAVLGLTGGFLTPALLSANVDREVALFTYVSLLDAGVLAVAYFKRWRSLDFLSFAGTVLMTLGWALSFYANEKLAPTLFFATFFFVLYSLLALFHNVLPRRRTRWFDVALLAANATFYFGLSYLWLTAAGYDTAAPASQALLVSAFFVALFYAAWRRSREDVLLTHAYVGAAATFFTIALAIQLELYWVTIAWSAEALALVWVGLRSGERAPRHAALGVFCAAVVHWFAFDAREFAYGVDPSFVPLLNRRALSCAALVGAAAVSAALYRRARDVSEDERSTVKTFFALAGNAAALVLLTLDVNDYFAARLSTAGAGAGDLRARVENAREFSVSALWTIYAATLLALGVLRRFALLRWVALLLLAAVTAKVAAVDASFYAAAWHVPFFNHTFAAFAVLVAALAFGARLYARAAGLEENERAVAAVLTVAANVLAVVALSAEAAGYFDAGRVALTDTGRLRDLALAKQLSLSVVWALYGAGLLVAGRVRRLRLLRLMSLALLSLTTLKVFFWDLSSLDRVYRIISFIVLGAILLAVSYLYQKSQQRAAAEES